ncbi:PAS domain-containing protein [Allocatelliglobosispora scoriae]|uniref:PAS domain-containing protein n=1 Tax=Allocatelliglobosispora scoriae TaxID=643052 RepID=A0A841BW05_9ACTN|nr:hypothetical protein [Allocatelliglobosispora scoriae]MBB5870921.1 PAS domain-containing protein [Allocatelliglobosispora scoriae]
MTHVELSLSPTGFHAGTGAAEPALERWATALVNAGEAALIIDAEAQIVAYTASCARLLCLRNSSLGGRLHDALRLIDFTAAGIDLPDAERDLIPPLLAIASGRLARGLIRVRCVDQDTTTRTLDAISTPVRQDDAAVGSLTFLCEI